MIEPITEHHTVVRPTMIPTLKAPGNKGTEVIMVSTGFSPDPGPPPEPEFDDLAVADGKGSNWLGSNVYVVGETVEGKTAEFTGGKPPVNYRYRFQTQAEGSDSWVNQPWTTTTNAKNSVFFELVEPGKVKFQSQARDANDPIVQLNSNTGTKTVTTPIVYDPLVVGDPVVTGDPIVGSTLSCSEPSIDGGSGDYQCDYFWVDESNAIIWEAQYMGNTTTVVAYDIDKNMKCLVQVTDKGWSGGESVTVSSNSVGPVRAPVIGDVTVEVDSSPYTPGVDEMITTRNGEEHVIAIASRSGDPGVAYSWDVRQGQARLTSNKGTCIVQIESVAPQGVQVQCNMTNVHASDNPQSFRIGFFVGE